MRTVTVLCRKGGTGKTTIALSLALAAHLRRHRVVVADVDPQKSSQAAAGLRKGGGPAVLTTTGGKLFTIKSAAEKASIDLLLIDTPSTVDASVLQAVQISDFCILVTRPNYLDIAAAAVTASTLRQLRMPVLIVLNQAPPSRGGTETQYLKRARDALALTNYPVAKTAISSRTSFAVAISKGLSVEELEPGGAGALEIAALWDDVVAAANIQRRPAHTSTLGEERPHAF